MKTKNALKMKAQPVKSMAFLAVTSLLMSANVSATYGIYAAAAGAGINIEAGCQTCHASASGSEKKANLKAGIAAAYNKSGIPGVAGVLKPPVVKPPTVAACQLPKMLVKGKCTVTATSCRDAAKDYARENDDDDDKLTTGLVISTPSTKTIHVGQTLTLGVTASGDSRKISMGVNLPSGAQFTETYNNTLQVQQAVVTWKVPSSVSGKTVAIKFCAETHTNTSSGKQQNKRFVARDAMVKVLPKLKSVFITQATVEPVIASAVYNAVLQQLVVSGQVVWPVKSSQAQRNAALAGSVQLTNANNAAFLGVASIQLNGNWSVSIPLSGAAVPRVVDATFQGAVTSKLVKKY
ncbi:hypothetical protein [Crenothrix polyspora]|uniref:Cytochrome c domain-containing protein n=1 Tax=Crenothrix polyspora TaxID=360316 RepID=A0A1R4HHW9_9GAMM|nr:hypothetical protein [Crenothrix polyspora]SJM95815.1 exported hypothetical protein [Crenothrix polyspora]